MPYDPTNIAAEPYDPLASLRAACGYGPLDEGGLDELIGYKDALEDRCYALLDERRRPFGRPGPGSTYTREGPTRDAAGRLADFARFADAEFDEIATPDDLPPRVGYELHEAREHVRNIAELMPGYTTAAD